MDDLALLVLRLSTGGFLMGHGAQKLFGMFEGPGLEGTAGWLESMGMRPGKQWAWLAALSEFGGGALTLLGFVSPVGPLGAAASMGMATFKVHAGKPIWVTSGGAELPVTNMAIAAALMLAGPGKMSLDNAFGLKLPRWLALPGLAVVAAGIWVGLQTSEQEPQSEPVEEAGAELQAGREAAHAV
jgi:putative oxidoreductase